MIAKTSIPTEIWLLWHAIAKADVTSSRDANFPFADDDSLMFALQL